MMKSNTFVLHLIKKTNSQTYKEAGKIWREKHQSKQTWKRTEVMELTAMDIKDNCINIKNL